MFNDHRYFDPLSNKDPLLGANGKPLVLGGLYYLPLLFVGRVSIEALGANGLAACDVADKSGIPRVASGQRVTVTVEPGGLYLVKGSV